MPLPNAVTGTDGNTHRRTYDERGNRTSVTDPGARQATHFTFTAAGHLTSVRDPLGHTTRVLCDRAGLPIEVTDPLGAVTRYTRDAFGRPIAITDPTGATAHLEWTVEGHLARRTAPDCTTESWTYDGEGNCTSHTDPIGGVTHFEIHPLRPAVGPHSPGRRPLRVHPRRGTAPDEGDEPSGPTWEYVYDPAGRLTSRRNALGEVTAFERDARDPGDLCETVFRCIGKTPEEVAVESADWRSLPTQEMLRLRYIKRWLTPLRYMVDVFSADDPLRPQLSAWLSLIPRSP